MRYRRLKGMVADDVFKGVEEEVSLTKDKEGTARRKSWPATNILGFITRLQSLYFSSRLKGVQNQRERCAKDVSRTGEGGVEYLVVKYAWPYNLIKMLIITKKNLAISPFG